MDDRLKTLYSRELTHIRESAAEFAREFPKIAGRLGMDGLEVADPYVERLIEGFAYLAARVQLKLDAEFPRFTQGLLETIYPHFLAPTPSMAVVQLKPDLAEGSIVEGFTIPRGRSLRSTIGKGDQTACEYRTAHPVTLYPIEVVSAEYHTRGLSVLQAPTVPADKAGIRLRLRCTGGATFDKIGADALTFYLHGVDQTPSRIYEQLLAHARAVVVQPVRSPVPWTHTAPDPAIRRVGFDDDQALLPFRAPSFQGYRLIHEYFALPQRFRFVELRGLGPGFRRVAEAQVDVVILLRQADLELEKSLDAACFQLHCTPAVNLFPRRTDRIHVSDRFSEFHVVPDRTRPLDFEVYEPITVTGYGESAEQTQEFRPFYAARDLDRERDRVNGYFSLHRVPRRLTEREKQFGRRSDSYAGSEVFISLVDADAAPYAPDLQQIGVEALCTNRDLPIRMPVGRGRTDFTLEEGAPVESIRCLAGPTRPRPSPAEGDLSWRAISHLALNYYSITDSDPSQGAAALRDLLRLYAGGGEAADPAVRKEIEGVRSVVSRPVTRRVQTSGPIAFARGLEVTVVLDEAGFEGSGAFVLGAVLEQFFAKYVSINSFTETVIRTVARGEIMRWPARVGLRHIL